MKDQATFIRWGLPGWTTAITFVIFIFSDYLSLNDDRMYKLLNQAFASAGIWQAILAGLLVAGAGVPMGFIIYQIYFYIRWNSPISKDGLFPPLILGRWADIRDTTRDLDEDRLTFGDEWRRHLLSIKDHRVAWHYLSALMYDAIGNSEGKELVYIRYNYLKDLVHALGASHLGLTLGFWIYLLMKWKLAQAGPGWPIVSLVVMVITFILVSKEDGRDRKPLRFFNMKAEYPAELFLTILVFMFLSFNPALNLLLPFLLPTILGMAFLLWWGWSVKQSRQLVWGLAIVLFVVIYLLKMLLWVNTLAVSLNWPVIFSILLFSCISLAFLKNRQNTREDLVVMEHYYLQKYLSTRNNPQV